MCVFSRFACDAIPSQLLYFLLYLKSLQKEQTIVCFPNPTGRADLSMCADLNKLGCGPLETEKNGAWVIRGVNCLAGRSGAELCGVRGKHIITMMIIIIIIINLHC